MKRERFKTTRVFVKYNVKDTRITSISINEVTRTRKPYILVFGNKMYITEQEVLTLTTTKIHYE